MSYDRKTEKVNDCQSKDYPPLELEIRQFGSEIRILREISPLEPAPKVWNPKSRSENEEVMKNCFLEF